MAGNDTAHGAHAVGTRAGEPVSQGELLRRTQAELAHAARVMSLGELSASIAHELSQPLATIVSHAGAAERWLAASPPNLERARHSVQLIAREGQRAGDMLWRMRRLMSRRTGECVEMPVAEVIRDVLEFVRAEAERHQVPMQIDLADDLPAVSGVVVELQQVVMSLVMNALEATAGETASGRPIQIRARAGEDRRTVIVEVLDRGQGIAEEQLERLFEAFHTTKPEGIGLSLAVGRSIAEAHGGTLGAWPREGGGMAFTLTLPTVTLR